MQKIIKVEFNNSIVYYSRLTDFFTDQRIFSQDIVRKGIRIGGGFFEFEQNEKKYIISIINIYKSHKQLS